LFSPLKPPIKGILKEVAKPPVRETRPASHIEGGCLPPQGIGKPSPEVGSCSQGLGEKYRVGVTAETLGSLGSIGPEARLGDTAIPFPQGPVIAGPAKELSRILHCLTGGRGGGDPELLPGWDDLAPPSCYFGGVEQGGSCPPQGQGFFQFIPMKQGFLLRITRGIIYYSKQKFL